MADEIYTVHRLLAELARPIYVHRMAWAKVKVGQVVGTRNIAMQKSAHKSLSKADAEIREIVGRWRG